MVPGQSTVTTLPGASRSFLPRALLVLLSCLFLAALSSSAVAQEKKTVVILDIQGGNKQLQQAIINALKDRYTIIPLPKWNAAAKKLNVTGQGTEEVAMVASDVKADAVVTGKVKQDKDSGGWKLNIAARQGSSGKPIGKISIDLKSQKVDPDTVAQVEKEIWPAVEKAIAGEAAEPAQPTEPKDTSAPTPSQLGVEEDPIAKMKKLEEQQKKAQGGERPVWYPFVDASAGFILNGRSFGFTEEANPSFQGCYDFQTKRPDPNNPGLNPPPVYTYGAKLNKCPRYETSVAGGVRVDVTGYPLAFMNIDPIRGLGIGVTFDYMFWPPSTTNTTPPVTLDTREFRFEVGLRYHWNILNKRSRPSILANVQFGGHYFAVAKQEKSYTFMDENFMTQTTKGIDDHGLPDIFYQYLSIGVGGRVPYYANDKMFFGLLVNFNFHVVLGFGEIGTRFQDEATAAALYGNGGYGPASGFGLRASFTPLEAMVWKGLTVRLSGFYELFKYSFGLGDDLARAPAGDRKPDQGARHLAPGATDNFFGAIVQVGYQY
jgi:hypothetical protein